MKALKILLIFLFALSLVACSSEDDEDDSSEDDSVSTGGASDVAFESECGVIVDSVFSSSIPSDSAELETARGNYRRPK